MAYGMPAESSTFFRKRRMPPMGLPMRPGELSTYGPAGGGSFGAPHLPDVVDVDGHALGCYLRPGLLGNDGAVSGLGA